MLKERSDSYEGFYARAKARLDLRYANDRCLSGLVDFLGFMFVVFAVCRLYDEALEDVQEALIVLPPQHRDIRRIMLKLKDEIKGGSSIASSVDTLNCPTETSL